MQQLPSGSYSVLSMKNQDRQEISSAVLDGGRVHSAHLQDERGGQVRWVPLDEMSALSSRQQQPSVRGAANIKE